MGIPEVGKAQRAIDGALERISYYRDQLAEVRAELTAECARQTRLEWSVLYVTSVADLMVIAPESDRVKFAAEIRDVALELDLLPEPNRYIARPADLQPPPDEGEWLIDGDNIHLGED